MKGGNKAINKEGSCCRSSHLRLVELGLRQYPPLYLVRRFPVRSMPPCIRFAAFRWGQYTPVFGSPLSGEANTPLYSVRRFLVRSMHPCIWFSAFRWGRCIPVFGSPLSGEANTPLYLVRRFLVGPIHPCKSSIHPAADDLPPCKSSLITRSACSLS